MMKQKSSGCQVWQDHGDMQVCPELNYPVRKSGKCGHFCPDAELVAMIFRKKSAWPCMMKCPFTEHLSCPKRNPGQQLI